MGSPMGIAFSTKGTAEYDILTLNPKPLEWHGAVEPLCLEGFRAKLQLPEDKRLVFSVL